MPICHINLDRFPHYYPNSEDDSCYVQEAIERNPNGGIRCQTPGRYREEGAVKRPSRWTKFDTFLKNELGYHIAYVKVGFGKDGKEKVIDRYNSEDVQRALKYTGAPYTEEDLLKDVEKIKDSCNLRGTTIKELPKLKEVGRYLTLDADSELESLPSFEHAGKIIIAAKDREKAEAYAGKLGINTKNGHIKNNLEFIIKSFI